MPRVSKDIFVAGISIDEDPRAEIWRFFDGRPIEYVSHAEIGRLPRSSRKPRALGEVITDCINSFFQGILGSRHKVSAVGLSIPGNIDKENFIVQNCPRLGLASPFNKDGGERLVDEYAPINLKAVSHRLPSTIDNDVACITRAVYAISYKATLTNIAYVYLANGVNVGVINNGALFRGSLNTEIGHVRARLEHMPTEWRKAREARKSKGKKSFCGFHDACVESIFSRRPIEEIWPDELSTIAKGESPFEEHHAFLADNLSMLCELATLHFAPQKILLGGYVGAELRATTIDMFNLNMGKYPAYRERLALETFIELYTPRPSTLAPLGAALQAYQEIIAANA